VIAKKRGFEIVHGRQNVLFAMEKYDLSRRPTCVLNGMARSKHSYEPDADRSACYRGSCGSWRRRRRRVVSGAVGVPLETSHERCTPGLRDGGCRAPGSKNPTKN